MNAVSTIVTGACQGIAGTVSGAGIRHAAGTGEWAGGESVLPASAAILRAAAAQPADRPPLHVAYTAELAAASSS